MPTIGEFISNFSAADAILVIATAITIVIAREKRRIFRRRRHDKETNS